MTLVFFPPNVTCVVQPLDQGLIASFKIKYRTFFSGSGFLSQYDEATLKNLRKVMPNIRQAISGVMKYEVSWMHKQLAFVGG